MNNPSATFPKLVWNRDTQGGRYAVLDGDGGGRAPAEPEEHRDYEDEKKGRPHRAGDGPRRHEGAIPGTGTGGGKPVPEVDPSADPPRSTPGT